MNHFILTNYLIQTVARARHVLGGFSDGKRSGNTEGLELHDRHAAARWRQ